MDHRPQLQTTLQAIKGIKGVYFSPSVNTKMDYPCIRFSLNDRSAIYADDKKYIKGESYTITFITRDAVKAHEVCDQLEDIPLCYLDRPPYVSEGLHHYVYIKKY